MYKEEPFERELARALMDWYGLSLLWAGDCCDWGRQCVAGRKGQLDNGGGLAADLARAIRQSRSCKECWQGGYSVLCPGVGRGGRGFGRETGRWNVVLTLSRGRIDWYSGASQVASETGESAGSDDYIRAIRGIVGRATLLRRRSVLRIPHCQDCVSSA